MLGAITLDLFAVLFGGAVALLPLFARSILHTGPIGLGVLRSAPAVGALAGAAMLARRPLKRSAGSTLLLVVAAFGVSTIVFGLSHSVPLSLVALAVGGFVDVISVNIRSTIAALAAPNELRGRVVAVEMVFISASNELGAFESGAAAALVGAVPAVVAGGVLTIALAAIWKWVFPALAEIDDLTISIRMRSAPPKAFCNVRRRMPTVRIPPILRPEAGGNREVQLSGTTVRELLESLVAAYPTLRGRIFERNNDLPQFLNVFIDSTDIRLNEGWRQRSARAATVILLPAVCRRQRQNGYPARPAPCC